MLCSALVSVARCVFPCRAILFAVLQPARRADRLHLWPLPGRRGVLIAGLAFGVLHNSGGRNPAFAAWASLVRGAGLFGALLLGAVLGCRPTAPEWNRGSHAACLRSAFAALFG